MKRWFWYWVFSCGVFSFGCQHVFARDCVGMADWPSTENPQIIEQLAERVRQAPLDCENDALHMTLKGVLAMRSGDVEAAKVALEKAVMLAPDLPMVLLEYAQVARQSGDVVLARGIVMQLLDRPDVPPGLASELKTWLAEFEQKAITFVRSRQQWLLGIGYDTNLNSGSSQTALNLTLPSGNLLLGLDPKYTAQSGGYVQGAWRYGADYALTHWAQGASLRLGIQAREPLHQTYNFSQYPVDLELALHHPNYLPGVRSHWARVQYIHYGGQNLLINSGTGLIWGSSPWVSLLPQGACRAEKGLDLEYREYPIDRLLNGLAVGSNYTMLCQNNSFWTLVQGRLQWDRALNQGGVRAGGDQWRTGLASLVGWQKNAWAGQLEARLDYQQDIDSYSVFIDSGAKRMMLARAAAAQLSYAWAARLKTYLRVEWRQQRSNISLFDLQSKGAFVGFSYEY